MAKSIPSDFEKRDALLVTEDGEVQLRAATATDAGDGFDGYVSTFWTLDSYASVFAPGAFKKSIRERSSQIPVLWQHDTWAPIGSHVEMKEDKTGLFVRTNLVDDGAEGSVALKRLRGGVPLGLSFGFETIRDRSGEEDDPIDTSVAPDWAKKLPKSDIRVITELRYFESSPVTFAANRKAKPTDIRSDETADLINSLMEELRAGTLSDERKAALSELVAAYQAAAAPVQDETPDPRTAPKARRDVLVELAALEAQYGRYGAVA